MKYLTVTVIVVILATTISAESCIKCNSKEDERCATDPTQIMPSACPNATSDCYARVLDGHTYRGCAQDLEPSLAEKCWNSTNDCDRCFGVNSEPGCNKGMIPVHRPLCHQCDGKLTDSCAIGNLLHPIPCPIYKVDDQCVTRKSIKKDTFYRGCLSSVGDLCKNISHCLPCDGNGCNNLNALSSEIPDAGDSAAIKIISFTLLCFMIVLTLNI